MKSLVPTSLSIGLSIWAVSLGFCDVTVAADYILSPHAKHKIEFHSKATLESFGGKAKSISAKFQIEPANVTRSRGTVTVDLRSLDTGIELRNKHMRENHLHTDTFPEATFVLDSVAGIAVLDSVGQSEVTIHGTMTLHGVTNAVSVPAILSPGPEKIAGAMRLRTEFPLKMTDYGIPRPEFLFLKLAEEVRIVVDLTVVPATD